MANLPRATTSVSDTAGAVASGTDTICVLAPVATAADVTPRLFGTAAAIYEQHGYSEGVEYAALHAERTRRPILFVGLPIATPGVVGREDTSGNSGGSVSTVTAGSSGVLGEHDGVVSVLSGGTVGTDQIVLGLSLDGGRTVKRVRLGTGTSYAIPYVGVTLSLTVGTLVAGDVIHTWHGTAPRADSDGVAAAREALAAQQRLSRTWLLIGDLQTDDEAAAVLAQADAYRTDNERFVFCRASVLDREPQASASATSHRMLGAPALTFAEVGATGNTITRSAGSWLADGFAIGDVITVSGSDTNDIDFSAPITLVTDTVITLDDDDLTDEVGATGVVVTGQPSLTFAAADDTVTRSRGSWLADGFRVGDTVTVSGTVGNDGTYTVAGVTALVLDLGDGVTDESIAIGECTVTAGQTKAEWMASTDAEFASVDAAPRISLAAGRGRVLSPLTRWRFRRSAGWAASLREYQHDLHVAPWRKSDGPTGFDLYDAAGQLVEWDDRVDGGAGSAARFTTLRTWANGPNGAFVAQSLTRASDASLLVQTHNQAVVDLACTVVQSATENVIGRSLVLNNDGTATSDSLSTITAEVNAALELALLTNRGEGQRASSAAWTPSADDVLNVPEALLTGTLSINLLGTIHSVQTTVRVLSGGQ